MDLWNEENAPKKNAYDSLPDYHLQNPLYSITDQLSMLKKGKRLNYRLTASYKLIKSQSTDIKEGDPIQLKEWARVWFSETELYVIDQTLSDCEERLALDETDDSHFDTHLLKESIHAWRHEFPHDDWVRMRGMQNVLIIMNAISSRRPPPPRHSCVIPGLSKITVEGGVVLVTSSLVGFQPEGNRDTTVFAADWVRAVSDVYTERFLVLSGAIMGRRLSDEHYPQISDLEFIINWGDTVLRKKGNKGFKLLKAYEALVLGVVQGKSESDFVDPDRFLRNTLNDIIDDDQELGAYAVLLINRLQQVESSHHLIQLFGLHRIWGHPLVDPAKGMEKMIIIGQKDIVRETSRPEIMGVHFKKLMAQGYREKHGVYPNVKGNGELETLIKNNHDWKEVGSLDNDNHWRVLRFDKTFSIPESFNLSMIVADKSVSPTLSELKENILRRKSVMNQELRRGVLRWINHDSIDPREFLEQVNDKKFPDDHKVIGLRSKEREMNPTPRMFALMSHLMRVYVVITESMLSEHILPYFPQITMTDSQLDLTKKTYSTVKNQAAKVRRSGALYDTKTVCMSLDFEKWNGHMRKESTFHVFEALGDLFGMENLYNETYDIFRDSYFYLADGSYVPAMDSQGNFTPEPPYSFTGHKGGQEGLRQKGWTIFTVVCLDWICRKHNCTYKIMGMGDNQVLQLTMYTYKVDASGRATERGKEEMQKVLFGLFDDLLDVFSDLGLPLKPLETWISEDLFVYGKYPVLKGVPLSMDLKKIMRIFPFSNQETMTIENALNTIAGNAQAATQAAPFLGVSYLIGLYMISLCSHDMIVYHPLIAKGLREVLRENRTWGLKFKGAHQVKTDIKGEMVDETNIRRLMMNVPRILGGYVSFNLYGLMMRGFPDPVSLAYSQLFSWGVTKGGSEQKEYMLRWIKPIFMPERSMRLLVEDVSSINLLAPVTPTAGLRRVVEQYLTDGRVIKNAEFRDLMMSRDNELEDVISEHLCSGDNLHIRLIHDIMESTIFGYVKSITSKVTKSSTIVSLAIGKAKRDPLTRLMGDEENYFRFFMWRSVIDPDYDLPACPTDMAKQVRKIGWGKELIGVTVAYPWSFLTKTDCYDSGNLCTCDDGFISLFLPDSPVTPLEWDRSIGKNPPYLGSMTKEKVVISTGSKVYSGEPLVRRPINLMRVIGWFVPEDSETAKIIMSCVSAVSDVNPLIFKGMTEGTSGSEIHRFRDTSLKHGALCSSNYLYSTRYHVSTDTFTRYAKGAQNYDMLFQANLCAIVETTHQYVLKTNHSKEPQRKTHHYKQTCYNCINPLDESFYDVKSSKLSQLIPSKKTNKYLYVPEAKISMTLEHVPAKSWEFGTLSSDGFDQLSGNLRLQWLTDAVADNVVIDILNPAGEESYTTTSLMDIKEHNRLFYLTIRPRDFYDQLCNRILILAEWRCMSLSDWKTPTTEAISRAAEAIIGDTPISRWYGVTGFFSWPTSMERYYVYPEIQEPDSIPVTALSACRSVRNSLLGLLGSSRKFRGRNTRIFSEDAKASKLSLKLMVYDWVKKKKKCRACHREIGIMSAHQLSSTLPNSIICPKGHYVTQGLKDLDIMRSRVTLDSLRKGCSSDDMSPDPVEKKLTEWAPLTSTTCKTLFDSSAMRSELIPFSPTGIESPINVLPIPRSDLYKLISLPTNAMYKYMEVISSNIDCIRRCKTAFVTGNGLGGTSKVLSNMWPGRIITSTLLDTGDAIPQVYPNCDKGSSSYAKGTVISDLMVTRVNDVNHLLWEEDWKPVFQSYETDLCISDIEINGELNHDSRQHMIATVVMAHEWKMVIMKDYIYTMKEMEHRLSILLPSFKSVEMITCNSRQRVMPEVWWIMKARCTPGRLLGYHRSVIRQLWDGVREGINTADWSMESVFSEINRTIASTADMVAMNIKLKAFFSLPIVGSVLPYKGSYTRLLGYLQRGKKPKDISLVTSDDGKRLYLSDYEKVRSVLFGLAVGMCSSATDRDLMLDESEFWAIDWIPSGPHIWLPYLFKGTERSSLIHVYDYIPMLTLIMKRERLLFKNTSDIIEFKYTTNRDTCCFPITKTAKIKFNVK